MQKRENERKPFAEDIQYSVVVLDLKNLQRLHLKGDVVDISDAGIGIHTDYPLEPGHVLTFHNDIGHEAGIVAWSARINNDGYRVGVKFV